MSKDNLGYGSFFELGLDHFHMNSGLICLPGHIVKVHWSQKQFKIRPMSDVYKSYSRQLFVIQFYDTELIVFLLNKDVYRIMTEEFFIYHCKKRNFI